MSNNKYRYSEIFTSIQGEGNFIGSPTIWLRWFLCNLQCCGFGQTKPEDPKTHELPYKTFDVSNIKNIKDLPVWDKGCDSSYSWAKKYRHLCPEVTASEIVERLEEELRNNYGTNGQFRHVTNYEVGDKVAANVVDYHFCMTGGEPMLPRTQKGQIEVLKELEARKNLPWFITVETNGTQPLSFELEKLISSYRYSGGDWFWSVSPKLLHTSGEKPDKAIKPAVIKGYADVSPHGQLKFVVSNRDEAWRELEETIGIFRQAGVDWPIWIMPVGATVESQESDDTIKVIEETIRRGYNVSPRLHAYIWGNKIGT